jgi:hypothetical protein
VQEVIGKLFHCGVGDGQDCDVSWQKRNPFTIKYGNRVVVFFLYLQIRRAIREDNLLIQFIAQTTYDPLDDAIVEGQTIIAHWSGEVTFYLEVVPMKILTLGFTEDGEVGNREIQCMFGDLDTAISRCVCITQFLCSLLGKKAL